MQSCIVASDQLLAPSTIRNTALHDSTHVASRGSMTAKGRCQALKTQTIKLATRARRIACGTACNQTSASAAFRTSESNRKLDLYKYAIHAVMKYPMIAHSWVSRAGRLATSSSLADCVCNPSKLTALSMNTET